MLKEERHKLILNELDATGLFDLKAFSRVYEMSEMTLYRDLQYLETTGKLIRISGGAKLLPIDSCVVCHKQPQSKRQRITLHLISGVEKKACCAHCALIYLEKHMKEVQQILGTDFLMDTTVNVKRANFVIGANLPHFCCDPSVYLFSECKIATQFTKGFGGRVLSLEKAIEEVSEVMSCCKHTKK